MTINQIYNPATLTDGYKLDHRRQYPQGTEFVYANWTPRGSRNDHKEVVFFGLQYFLKRYLEQEFRDGFFNEDIEVVCEQYTKRVNGYLGKNSIGTDHIRALHALGYIPLEFKALPEGTMVPLRVPMFIVENTHPQFGWVTNYFETLLSSVLWMPCTSATTAFYLRKILEDYADRTGGSKEFIDWQGHDFSMRGMAGPEAAAMSGAGHLLSFTGTDTLPALDFLEDYYHGKDTFVGGSVAATEHSVMCAGGNDNDNEQDTYERLLNLYPDGIVSVVSDTWDLWHVLTTILPNIKDHIMEREGKLVIRPDSGDPTKIIVGDKDATVGSPAYNGVIELLWEVFGGTETNKGYRTLDSHIGAIYGDSINEDRMVAILDGLMDKGFASDNMVFGVGSYSYQYVTRDTYMFAMKSTNVVINGVQKPIYKDPITDSGMKKSLKGRIAVVDVGNDGRPFYVALDEQTMPHHYDALRTVWKNGQTVIDVTLEDARKELRKFI